jgi:hypothetical protein
MCTLWAWGLWGIWRSSLRLRTCGLVHLWGLTVGRSTFHRGVQVDVLGHSTQRLTNQKIVKEEIYSRCVYIFERWIGIIHRGPDGGVKAEVLCAGSLILILPVDLHVVFLAFFWGAGLVVAFFLPTRVFKELALALVEGSLVGSSPGGRAKTGMARIRMSPSKPRMREIKLSKPSIQTKET